MTSRPYQPLPVPSAPGQLPRYIDAELNRLAAYLIDTGSLTWGGVYVPGTCYPANTVVYDDGWLLVSKRYTCDKPAPVPVGPSVWTLPDSPLWDNESASAGTLGTGQRYTSDTFGFINAVRVWLPVASENTFYRLLINTYEDPADPDAVIIANWFTTTQTGWNPISSNRYNIPPNVPFEIILQTQNRTGLELFAANYNYQTPNNEGIPTVGAIIHAARTAQFMRIDKTDADGNNMALDLAKLIPGDTIEGAGIEWTVSSTVDAGSYYEVGVTPAAQGAPSGVGPFNFTHYEDQPIPYVAIPGNWSANPSIQGVFNSYTQSVSTKTLNETAYGTDVQLQAAQWSDDWEVLVAA